MRCDLWDGGVGKLERETSSEHLSDLPPSLPLAGAHHHHGDAALGKPMDGSGEKESRSHESIVTGLLGPQL